MNFGNNSLTRDFSARPTLISFNLDEGESIGKVLDITSPTNIPNVDVIGCDEGNFSPSEILSENNLLKHLEKLKQVYDFILIEGPALNTHADSKEILDYAEGVVLVFSARNTVQESDRESIAYLKSNRGKLIGAVLEQF